MNNRLKQLMNKSFRLILVCMLLVLGSGSFLYYGYARKKGKQVTGKVQQTAHFYRRINDLADFKAIQGAPLSARFNDVWSIKLVYDTETDELYYIRSDQYRYHFEFCTSVLRYNQPLEVFNMLNYGNSSARRFYLANLNYYTQSHYYTLEFSSDDRISAAQINTLFKEVLRTSYLGAELRLLVSSAYLSSLDDAQELKLPRIYPSEIYNGQQYQLLNKGKAFGILRMVTDLQQDYAAVQEGDILVTKGTPAYVPVCAGILTNSYQTPLSHINILCHNRDIPAAVVTDAWERQWDTLQGKPVCLVLTEDSFYLRAATLAELDSFRRHQPLRPLTRLDGNPGKRPVMEAGSFGLAQRYLVGNKAAGLGELYKIAHKRKSQFEVPEGSFAIPFYFYKQHIAHPAIQEQLKKLWSDTLSKNDPEATARQLKLIRKCIKEAPLDPGLVYTVTDMITANNCGNAYRFRSSSNAEDRDGFSGAGLYDSKTGILGDTAKSIEKAIKAVWASAWNEAAYRERKAWNIDQRSVLMGILAHRSFPDEQSNGVAITRNIYRPDYPGMTVNVQIGEVEVVSPPDSVTCEQFVCVPVAVTKLFSDGISVDYITRSSLTGSRPVLNIQQVARLYEALEQVKAYMYGSLPIDGRPEYEQYGLDIEFKFDRNNKLYLKQVRPYY